MFRIVKLKPVSARGIALAALVLVLLPGTLAAQRTNQTASVFTETLDSGEISFYAENRAVVPAWITVEFQELTNLQSDIDLPLAIAVPPRTQRELLFTLSIVEPARGHGYRYSYSVAVGDPSTAHHNDDILYLFPYAHGTKHRVTQGHNGDFSHFGENQYALDFDLDEGVEIYAARDGIVARVKEDSRVGGVGSQYAAYGNNVMIAHDDGSFGNYVHLRYRGAVVEEGERVEAGQRIGYSGSTGLASGPHLHFDVRLPRTEGGMMSIPVRFLNADETAVEPAEGQFYYALHPGKPPFEMVFGSDMSAADFAGYEEQIPIRNRIDFRSEQNDLTFAIFIRNSFDYPLETTISFRLQGMTADGDFPAEVRIPAGTELFVTLLRADPDANHWQWAPSVQYRRGE